ncbi:MAG: hypothetical protein GX434_17705 [Peptococcaceae bacterium]|nr:hypothetical protein [Peptococcaceae bacterium]
MVFPFSYTFFKRVAKTWYNTQYKKMVKRVGNQKGVGGYHIKKSFLFLPVLILLVILQTNAVYADAGPKPSIVIEAKNMPDKLCYMDLLVERQASATINNEFDSPKYNQKLVSMLKEYHQDGMSPLLVNGLMRTHGDIICDIKNGESTTNYSYMVPDQFKIIMVSEDGNTVVSNLIERKSFNSVVSFDYTASKGNEVPFYKNIFLPFILTCIITILIEGIVLFLFRFNLRENMKAFLLINISTQILLYIMISLGMTMLGIIGALFFYLLAEMIIFILEAILFCRFLTQHSKVRRIVYSITSNFASFSVPLLVMMMENWRV